MKNLSQGINVAALSAVEKMELADVLYDSAQQELEARTSPLTDEQTREVERRVRSADAGGDAQERWDLVYARLWDRP